MTEVTPALIRTASAPINALPILFQDRMVRALLEGCKTQTRRTVKDPGQQYLRNADGNVSVQNGEVWNYSFEERLAVCPYGKPGDLLYVREACWMWGRWHRDGLTKTGRKKWRFKAEGQAVMYSSPGHENMTFQGRDHAGWVWRTSIHMPRWASRLTLRITDIRVQELHEISEEDAEAEGVEPLHLERDDHDFSICPRCGGTGLYDYVSESGVQPDSDCLKCDTHAKRYQWLWISINGEGSLDDDPYVWAITFDVIRKNVDEVLMDHDMAGMKAYQP